ncbi:hypothetical protein E4U42_003245 [Claviceps africana]|uniref:Short chain dehydrogenase n=1 Tax=Claviceps africana TaxID=83212 RepID=A0A8K0J6Y1_9HYPO|nr:hypothetical protein E4U42_003245 [Claviceps africana]
MASRPWIFVCPSSRGIGFHLTRHLLQTTTMPILATTRSPDLEAAKTAILSGRPEHQPQPQPQPQPRDGDADGDHDGPRSPLDRHASRLHLTRVDVTDEPSIERAAQLARDLFPPRTHHLHLSFAIPGVLKPEKSPLQIDAAASLAMFRVNCAGPLLLAKHFVGFMPRAGTVVEGGPAAWVFMSARVGSVTENRLGGWYSYRASKAGVNSAARSLDWMLRARSGGGAMAVAYHPGTVRTDFSREFWGSVEGREGFLEVEDAVGRMVGVVRGLDGLRDGGKCLDWRGEVVPP